MTGGSKTFLLYYSHVTIKQDISKEDIYINTLMAFFITKLTFLSKKTFSDIFKT